MGVVLDTSVIVAAERSARDFAGFLESLGDEPVAIAAITASELLHGCLRAQDAAVRARRSAFVDALLDTIPVLPFGLPEARRHADLWAELVFVVRGSGVQSVRRPSGTALIRRHTATLPSDRPSSHGARARMRRRNRHPRAACRQPPA